MFSINIGFGNTLSIDNENVSYKGKSLKINEIDKIRHSTKRRNVFIWLGDEHGREIKIDFGMFSFSLEENFYKVSEEFYRIVVPVIVKKINDSFNRGESITMSDCTINKEGISYIKTTLSLTRINGFLKWQDAGVYYCNESNKMIIKDEKKIAFGTIKAFDVRQTWNAVLLLDIQSAVTQVRRTR